ncbi:NDP-sugar synthase [Phototrophicus methaneseepsis]|uniref:NDP-sugar synthase n=1 Tax=Phototrophicus methaneseepsis TaxID=2710758 RepID=A0A7S8E5X4_9CHLR|nr:NDP-sugar synthase [Phototrophicus methaneseepsis]QPC80979.1 NDP-sugar synthase [Phototrophicus methaneseepsis]
MIESAVIIAADATTSMSPILPDRPPILWPVLGKPMVLQAMEPLYRAGIRHFTLLLGMTDTSALNQLQRRWMPDARLNFALKMPEETLPQALERIAGEVIKSQDTPILVQNYNAFLDSEAQEALFEAATSADIVTAHYQPGTIAQPANEDALAGVATLKPHLFQSLSKSSHANTLRALLSNLNSHIPASAAIPANWAIHVQTLQDLLQINTQLLANSPDSYILSEVSANVRIVPPVHIDPQVSIGQGAVIGPNVYLERGTRIGYRARVDHAIILDRGTVDASQTVSQAIITINGRLNI